MRLLRQIRRSTRGVAAVETGLIALLFFVPLGLGAMQFGILISVQSGLDTALQGGLNQVWHSGAVVTADINKAANASWGVRSQTLTIATPTKACYCLADTDSRGSTAAVPCSTTCTGTTILATYVTLAVSTNVPLVAPLPMLSSTVALNASATVRVPAP